MKTKETVKTTYISIKRIVTNAEQFIQAASLLVIAGFSYYALSRIDLNAVAYYTILAALIVIGLRGAYEMIRFLDREVK